jgi:hypothetical protein
MSTGETVAVKVLGANSRQGEQEFLTEVIPDDMLRFLSTCLHLKEDFYFIDFSLIIRLFQERFRSRSQTRNSS